MATYRLLIKPTAAEELEAVPLKDRRRIAARMRELADDPRSAGAEKLRGHDLFRIRQGDYRVVYAIDDHDRTATVFKVGHRREVYR